MSKVRRLRVESLSGVAAGDVLPLPEDETAHVRVLRLKSGDPLELFDSSGRSASATLASVESAKIESVRESETAAGARILLATAWPKGKRAALLVEKCSELGVSAIIPVKYARSVVSKDDQSEGITRLKRIATEAAKQSGRCDVPEILPEQTFAQAVENHAHGALSVLLDPRAERQLADVLREENARIAASSLLLFVGPEGGFEDAELVVAEKKELIRARLGRHILRVETAALAACAVAGAIVLK